MPPRRPTAARKVSASETRKVSGSKRKRAEVDPSPEPQQEEDHDPEDGSDEGVDTSAEQAPQSKSRTQSRRGTATGTRRASASRQASAPVSRSRKAAVGSGRKPSVQPVQEENDDSDDVRGKEDDDDDFEEVDVADVPPAPKRSRTARATRKKVASSEEEEEDGEGSDASFEEEEIKAAKSKSRSKAKASTASTTRKSRGASAKPPSRASTSARGKKGGAVAKVKKEVIEDIEEEEEEEDRQATPRASRVNAKEPSPEVDGTETKQSTPEPAPTPTPARALKSKPPPVKMMEEEDSGDEPEESLLDKLPPVTAPKPRLSMVPPLPSQNVEPEGPRSRLVIHKMVLVNFKSYAGRQVIGPFHKSFSAIVGPNGSGKSNTIDALLFVFGYRASKMRQGKLSELIHNSAKFPDLDECSVEVHFREIIDLPGPDAYEIVPNSQIVVARYAYKSNSSKYTINNRTSSFTEVTTLLKGRGIDLDHKRFLILQGEVESIAQMKPKAASENEDDGLLEYLEDIIGTTRYKQPIEDALAALDVLAEKRGEKLNRLRIVEREKNALEEKKREAEEFLRLQNEFVRAQSRLYQFYLWKCLEADQQYAETIETLEQELEEETERNKDDITHCQMLEDHYKERGEAYEEVKVAAAEAVKDLAVHEKQQVNLEERKKHATTKAKKLKKTLQEDQKARDEALRFIDTNTEKIEKEKGKITEYEASLVKEEKILEGIRDSLKDKTQVFHDQIEAKQKELQPWTAKMNAKQAEIDVAVSERNTLAEKAEAVKSACKEAQENFEQLQAAHQAKESEKEDLMKQRADVQKELKSGEQKLQALQKDVEGLRAKASSSRQKVDEAKSSQAASTSQNKVLDSLTKLKNSGRISGFHGRLGGLGAIPEKYDVAISTACPMLNHLIVDTVEQGQHCIEYLRKQNVGRASFIVLEKLDPHKGLDKIQTPENVPRLIDLITPREARFAPAFFKAVGNTLVASDLEQANRIAYGAGAGARRWRVVTLAGQLIDVSGTMSGGGTSVARGLMSARLAGAEVQPEVMKKYEKESAEAAAALEGALRAMGACEAEVERLSGRVPEMDMALQKVVLDIRTGEKRVAEAEKRIRELRSKNKPNEGDLARMATLDKEIASSEAELEKLKQKAGVVEAAIQALEKKILDIGGAKLLTQKSKVDGIKLHINLAMDELTKAEVNKAKAEKDAVRYKKAVEGNSGAMEEIEAELAQLEAQLKECKGFVSAMQSKVDAAQEAAENAKDDLESLKAELDAKTEEIQKFRQREMDIKQRLNDAKKDAHENEKAIQHYSHEHDKLKLEDVDDDDEEDEDEDAPRDEGTDSNTKPRASEDQEQEEGDAAADVNVKAEPTEEQLPAPRKEKRERTPSSELHIYSNEELAQFRKKELLADVALLDEQVKNSSPNLAVLKEYRKREQEFLSRAKDLEEVTAERDAQKATYDGLRKQRLDEFMTGFNMISAKLKEMYQMITLGGNAELELVDSMDPFSEGIIFSVMPPKKSWKNISNLSGGEKTLSSLALVFALHVFKPTPLYFMDEIDAALDFRNVSIVANYIKDRTKNAQFIIISLRNDMFELSHRLIGIYKTSNQTHSISINNHALNAAPQVALGVARGNGAISTNVTASALRA